MVFCSSELRRRKPRRERKVWLEKARQLSLHIFDLRDGFVPYEGDKPKVLFEQIKKDIPNPDIIFTHYRHDLHQDHRKINQLTWNTFRNHLIFEYEIPKWDGDLGVPNAFCNISEELCGEKVHKLHAAYDSTPEI